MLQIEMCPSNDILLHFILARKVSFDFGARFASQFNWRLDATGKEHKHSRDRVLKTIALQR